jgi:hypothetical protein
VTLPGIDDLTDGGSDSRTGSAGCWRRWLAAVSRRPSLWWRPGRRTVNLERECAPEHQRTGDRQAGPAPHSLSAETEQVPSVRRVLPDGIRRVFNYL